MIIHIGRHTSQASGSIYEYTIAGQLLQVDTPVDVLFPFIVHHRETAIWQSPLIPESQFSQPEREVVGWIGEAWREVTCYAGEQGYHLKIEGVGSFTVGVDGSTIVFKESGKDPASGQLAIEALLGPALSMALASKGIFCLHASALLADNRIFAFLGDSGAGKSTVVAYLASHVEGWQRIADDILPIAAEDDEIVALPRFPQLKLSTSQQVGPDVADRIPMGGVYLLDVPAKPATPAVIPLDSRDGAANLIKHTVATSLFDERLLGPHLALCANIAAQVPAKRLIYPHDQARLPEIARVLAADITGTT